MTDTLDPRFGAIAPAVTQWSVHRLMGEVSARLGHPDADGVTCERWPIADLSIATLRERWGAGRYRCNWFGVVEGKNASLGKSPVIELTATNAENETPEPEEETASGDAYAQYERIQQRAERRAQAE